MITLRERLETGWGGGVVIVVLFLFGMPLWAPEWARLEPGPFFGWVEPWRLLLGHWVHQGWSHWLLNGVALAGWYCLWPATAGRRLLMVAVLSLAVGSAVSATTQYDFVLGLSGLLHGLFAASALQGWRYPALRPTSIVALTVLAVKVGYEQLFGAVAATEDLAGLPVAINAHLYGLLAGCAYFAASLVAVRQR